MVNRDTSGHIVPSQGVMQGDPFSPYLFILCSEGLFNLLFRANRNKCFQSIKASRGGPFTFHLLFPDDSMIFYRALVHDFNGIKSFLHLFKNATGQQINFDKSLVLFNSNTNDNSIRHYANILGLIKLCRMIGFGDSIIHLKVQKTYFSKY